MSVSRIQSQERANILDKIDRICVVVLVGFQFLFSGSFCKLNLHANQEQHMCHSNT